MYVVICALWVVCGLLLLGVCVLYVCFCSWFGVLAFGVLVFGVWWLVVNHGCLLSFVLCCCRLLVVRC